MLRATVGILLLLFVAQWLRKGIWRLSQYGFKLGISVDEDDGKTDHQNAQGIVDWIAFVIAFKGALLKGLEMAFIVVTFGAITHNIELAVLSAGTAFVIVIGVAVVIQKALKNIPGHVIKFSVGLLLSALGVKVWHFTQLFKDIFSKKN